MSAPDSALLATRRPAQGIATAGISLTDYGVFHFRKTCSLPAPLYVFLTTLCGVELASPGFTTGRIDPQLGALSIAEGTVAHSAALIPVNLTREGAELKASAELPAGLTGQLLWNGQTQPQDPGTQRLTFSNAGFRAA